MSEQGPLVTARGVAKRYRIGRKTIEALRQVDLVADTGEFLVIHGASGAGKSTLLHLLGGLDRADSGRVLFRGRDLSRMGRTALARCRNLEIGFIFQAYHLFPEFSALENILLPGRIARKTVGPLAGRAAQLLDRVGLGGRSNHRPYELSGGEQQRVAIARALINTPALLLADEPTGNLDPITGGHITDLLLDLRKEFRTTLIMATHDQAIGRLADRKVHLADGCLPAEP